MQKADFAVIKANLNPEIMAPLWFPEGKRKGNEWVPAGQRSFTINMKTGKWKDFADEGVSGNDMISLYAHLHGMTQGEAAKELAENNGISIDDTARKAALASASKPRVEEPKPVLVMPVPAHAKAPTFYHPEHGTPARKWEYRNEAGELMMYILRYEPADGRKQITPYTWVKNPDGTERWSFRGITGNDTPRPLYGLEKLAADPLKQVVIVEGEKAADAAQELFGNAAIVMAWLGGVATAARADVSPLAGRHVTLWPDFDAHTDKTTGAILPKHEQPGVRAMLSIATNLQAQGNAVTMVDYEPDVANAGWDLADGQAEGWTTADTLSYLKTHESFPESVAAGGPTLDEMESAPLPAAPAAVKYATIDSKLELDWARDASEKGQPLNTIENLEKLMEAFGITAKYNEVRKAVELTIPGREGNTMDNRGNVALAQLTSICARNRMPQTMLADYVKALADAHSYNPVCQWIESKPWDGVERIQALLDTITVKGDASLKNKLMYRWLISAVASIYHPFGFESHGAIVFTGRQGLGKTRWFKALVPAEMGVTLDGVTLDPSDKDSIVNVVSHWLVELGELDATFRKADIAKLKAFVTKAADKLRRPYDRVESEYQRRTVFCASVNEPTYLVDDTGNRRWWTVPAVHINYDHGIDMQQVWAELLTHYRTGEQWWLTPEENESLANLNAKHEQVTPEEEMTRSKLDWDSSIRREMTATEVLVAIGYEKPARSQQVLMGKVLRKLTGEDGVHKKVGTVFRVPPMRDGRDDDYDNGLPI
jgi:putative DNA primase/helicase